jgi:hypothetical protein
MSLDTRGCANRLRTNHPFSRLQRRIDTVSTTDEQPDPVVELYKRDVDLTLIRENLRLTPDQRVRNLVRLQRAAEELRRAGRAAAGRR